MSLGESECYRNTQESPLIYFILDKSFKNIIGLITTIASFTFLLDTSYFPVAELFAKPQVCTMLCLVGQAWDTEERAWLAPDEGSSSPNYRATWQAGNLLLSISGSLRGQVG